MTGSDCGRDECPRGNAGASRSDFHRIPRRNGQRSCIGRIDFDVTLGGGQDAEDVALIGSSAGVPLRRTSAAGEKDEWKVRAC